MNVDFDSNNKYINIKFFQQIKSNSNTCTEVESVAQSWLNQLSFHSDSKSA